MNLATKFTLVRIFLVPIFLTLMLINTMVTHLFALIVFILGGITDTIDGIIARKKNIITKFGATFDPLADKLLITTAFISFLGFKELNIPVWTVIVIVLRDYLITWIRSLDYSEPIPADKVAKFKTTLQNIAVIFILIILTFRKQIINFNVDKYVLNIFPKIVMIFVAIFTLISGIVYIIKYRKHILSQFEN